MARFFGQRELWREGGVYADRMALHVSGIHPPTQAGISYSQREGADSIVLSGGYVDDEDFGDEIVYTGMGGRDLESGKQVADQTLTSGNQALGVNKNEGLPVRVTRGANHISPFSPKSGYQYAGLYLVEDYWHEKGKHGFLVWRYRLKKIAPSIVPPAVNPVPPTAGTVPSSRQEVTYQRIVRDTATARKVKDKYSFKCQVCNLVIETPVGPYAEAAHIRPLGRPHNGPDTQDNLLCLCPNHHVMFDSGVIGIADDLTLIGLKGSIRLEKGHQIDTKHLTYHRNHYGLV